MEELISVIVPIYNGEKFVERITDALQKQTYENIEVIVVDDGSKDNTLSLLHQLMDSDKRFRIYNKKNEGVSVARNFGKEKAKGDYIAFIDADDYIFPDYFEYLYKLIKKYDADMACCNMYKMRDTEKIPIFKSGEREIVFSANEALENMLYRRMIHGGPCLKLYKREIVKNIDFPKGIQYSEDLCFSIWAIQNCVHIVHGGSVLYIYFQHDLSAVHNVNIDKLVNSWKMQKSVIREAVKGKSEKLEKAAYAMLFIRAADYISSIWNKQDYLGIKKELFSDLQEYDGYVYKDPACKNINRILAGISCVNTELMVHCCILFKLLKRVFKFETHHSI